jgi:esterase/lipase superfamily enzyme
MTASRLLASLLAAAFFLAGASLAQETPKVVSESCKDLQNASAQELDRRIASLQAAVAKLKNDRQAGSGLAPAQSAELSKKIRESQEDLMDLIFSRECLRKDRDDDQTLIQDAQARVGLRVVSPWATITTFYATNRTATGASNGITSYGPDRAGHVEYGRAQVSIPTARRAGELPLPSLWQLEFAADPSKHFILKRVEPLSGDALRNELGSALAGATDKSVLLFVHGFNVTFSDAALRTAQLAHDIAFPGPAMFYSWPSAGRTRAYFRDEEVAQLSEPAFNKVLDDLAAWGATNVYLIAHSMGTRIVTNALRGRATRNVTAPAIGELLLAAPDINEEIFRELIVPGLASLQQTRRTIYASANDVALKASKTAHEFRRVGDTDGGILAFAGFDIIDASAAAPLVRAFGHSYVMDSARVLDDITDILIRRKPVAERGLDRRTVPPNTYWLLR